MTSADHGADTAQPTPQTCIRLCTNPLDAPKSGQQDGAERAASERAASASALLQLPHCQSEGHSHSRQLGQPSLQP